MEMNRGRFEVYTPGLRRDASVAVEYLLRTALGLRLADRIERSELIAPELLDAEVLAAAAIHDAPLLTADGPLSRAPRLGVVIENVRA